MLAHLLVRHSTPSLSFQLKEVPDPMPGLGEVRIRVTAFGLNYADIMARQGLYRECPPLPCVIGYDVEGVIDQTGPDVIGLRKGDRVFALTRFGGYARYAVTRAEAVGLLPNDAPIGIGCALATQCVTAWHATMQAQTLLPEEKVLIHAAAGGLGTALIQIALWRGCTVIGVAGGKDKADYLHTLGVQHVINHHETQYQTYLHQHLDGKVDVVFDNIGGKSIRIAKSFLAPGGRIISLGAAALSGKKGIIPLLRLAWGFGLFSPIAYLGKSQSLIGINMLRIADYRPDMIATSFRGVQQLYQEGVLKPHIGRIFPSGQLADAHAFVEARKSIGKVVVEWLDD